MESTEILELLEIIEATRNLPKLRPLHDRAMRSLETEAEEVTQAEVKAREEKIKSRQHTEVREDGKPVGPPEPQPNRLRRAEVQGEDARNG